jgi:lipoprotein-anchoring transpeptidase ErfK/SrfK
MHFRQPPERAREPVWLLPRSSPVAAPAPRRRRRPSGGSSSLLLVVAVAAIATGGATVALGVAGSTSGPGAHSAGPPPADKSHHTAVTVAPTLPPIVIPAAPSTTAPAPAPAVDASAPVGPSPAVWRRYVRPAVPALVNSAPSVINDPSVIATATVKTLPLYPAPGAPKPSTTLANPNYLGATLVLLVTGYQPGWVQAYVPVRPNESTAWIPSADVQISFVSDHIVVSLSARTLTLYHDNTPVFSTPVAPGAPSSPTPTGSFFIAYIVKLTDPGNVYGPYAMGTSAFSNTYYSFDGGPGQVGIHGTNQPWVIGSYASHGCVRLPNSAITTVAQQVVPGTPVEIGP